MGACTWGYIMAPRYKRGTGAVRKESDEDLDADPILWASIPASATCGDSVSGCKPRTPRAARAEMLVLPSEDTGVADAMSKARESHRKLCVEEIAMLRLGGVASRTYLVAFPAIKQHFQQQGLDLDWVLYSSWDALVEAFVRREVDNQWC